MDLSWLVEEMEGRAVEKGMRFVRETTMAGQGGEAEMLCLPTRMYPSLSTTLVLCERVGAVVAAEGEAVAVQAGVEEEAQVRLREQGAGQIVTTVLRVSYVVVEDVRAPALRVPQVLLP